MKILSFKTDKYKMESAICSQCLHTTDTLYLVVHDAAQKSHVKKAIVLTNGKCADCFCRELDGAYNLTRINPLYQGL